MKQKVNELKRAILKAAAEAGEGHIASAFSILDILCVLYDRILEFDPKDHRSALRDRFILSKGHASLALYAVLASKGFFELSDIKSFGKFNSMFGGHPDRNKIPGVEASTGSLGHGFPMSVGVALGMRIKKQKGRVFTIVGDGECNEGSVWEAALLAAHHRLSNLCCIVDYNHSGDRALLMGRLDEKFRSFGWDSFVINGHDHKQIFEALQGFPASRPLAIIAETVKGCGSKTMENNPAWHHRAPTEEELESIMKELK